ncbi:MAG: hypothetical protein U0Q16_10020 [Bryobacteraceae bacterium]
MRALALISLLGIRLLAATCPAEPWDGTAPIDARIADGACRLRDLIPGRTEDNLARQYILDTRTRGFLNIDTASQEFDTALLLTDARFVPIASNDDVAPGRTDSHIVASVLPDTYFLFVIAKRASGAFTLRGTFDLGTGCQNRPLTGQVSGTLGPQSCRQLDVVAPSGSSVPVDLFAFQTDTPKVLSALMQSRTIDSYLAVIDTKTGTVVASDDDGADGVANALLIASVPPGDYLLVATVAGAAAGPYDLQTRLDDVRPCNISDLSASGSATGQLTEPDCRILDVLPPDDQDNRMDLFRVNIAEAGVLTADASSSAFPTAILLLDKDRKLLQTALPTTSTAAHLVVSLQPGDYILGVTHTQLSAGNYTVRTSLERLRPCDADTLAPGSAVTGRLNSGECRFLDAVPLSVDTTLAKPFKLTLEKRARVTLDMTSTEIDSFLWLLDDTAKAIAQDDNSGGGNNARIVAQVAPGTYTVVANTASVQSGGFEVKAVAEDSATCPVNKVTIGETATGTLAESDCATRDLMLNNPSATQARYHEVTLASAGTLTVDASSFSFAPSLILVDSNGKRITSDSLVTTALVGGAHIRRDLAAGTYGIIVTATNGRPGDYSIRTAFTAQ